MTPQFMLDTDSVSFALRGQGRVAERLSEHHPLDLCISAVTLAELRFGADLKQSKKLHRLIDKFCEVVVPLPFDGVAASRFGVVAAALTRAGTPIGRFDALIAAHALALGLTFVTNNTQHFNRVPGLEVENWT